MIHFLKIKVPQASVETIQALLAKGFLVQGDLISRLEREMASYLSINSVVALNSGTAALHLALILLGIRPGDEVITTPFTFGATANAILMCGAKPVFVDIDDEDFNIDPDLIAAKVSSRTKAIIPVDIFGRIADYDRLSNIAREFDLKILEDACQSMGASYNGKMAGVFGNVGVFSLYATKNLFAGEGGLLVTDDEELAERCRILRNHGQSGKERYDYLECGYNYRMTDLYAAIALPQLSTIDEDNQRRIENAKFYNESLCSMPGVFTPSIEDNRSVFHLYTVLISESARLSRNEVQNELLKRGIETMVYYPKPLHLYPPFKRFGYQAGDFPVAEKVCKTALSLPIYPGLTKDELETVADNLKVLLG